MLPLWGTPEVIYEYIFLLETVKYVKYWNMNVIIWNMNISYWYEGVRTYEIWYERVRTFARILYSAAVKCNYF